MLSTFRFKQIKLIRIAPFVIFFFLLTSFVADGNKISVHLESQRLHKGKVVTLKADIFFRNTEGVMIIHYIQPMDYVFITNLKGEAKIYYPNKNEVLVQQNQIFSSENDILYSFLSHQSADLGLKEAGFSLSNSKIEKSQVITTWLPPAYQSEKVSRIDLVHENYLPIYTAYYNPKGTPFKKIYYSNYFTATPTPFPQRIVEIDYLPTGDSIVSRKIYTDIKINQEANSPYFNFVIPVNAKAIKNNTNTKQK